VSVLKAATAPEKARYQRLRFDVRGDVQGVGFRPFAYRQAHRFALSGWVANTQAGVTIEVEGPPEAIDRFVAALQAGFPGPARIDDIERHAIPSRGGAGFSILASDAAGVRNATVLPDIAVCEACRAEVGDPGNRRYRYPFTNCTHCGPRYSIIVDLPYDRARTSMHGFVMCADCRREYDDPNDRRFHAEPNACPRCGPALALWDPAGQIIAAGDDALLAAIEAIRRGDIVAVKGIGGFHLMVDARSDAAVGRLRQRKHRDEKPFAVMFQSLAAVEAENLIEEGEADLLTSPARPIVLLRKQRHAVAEAVAPGNPWVGAMLPYTPFHHLLLDALGFPVVATSGNRSDEPMVTDEAEVVSRLSGIADLFLVHDRPIIRPVDDSVARIVASRPMLIRRARGYAPSPVAAPAEPGILALGGHLKTTIALTTGAGIVLGPHIGDLDTVEARQAFDRAVADLTRLHDSSPRRIACDLHPDYHSSRIAGRLGAPVVGVQHHLAHVAACMAEHRLSPPLLGVTWDGTGYGVDGTVWGGEFLRVTDGGWERVAHLRPFPLPGGEAAVREPRRSAVGLLHAVFGEAALTRAELAPVAAFSEQERRSLVAMIAQGINTPITTSAGRLFDAVAAILGLSQRTKYEGQSAAKLEWVVGNSTVGKPYRFRIVAGAGPLIVDWQPVLIAILADLAAGVPPARIAAAFHDSLALAIAEVAVRIGETTVALTGGCFQNRRLTEAAIAALKAGGLTPVWPERVPPNDGGLALGQAFWAARSKGDI
jgi:hydrogenase maturation protein HypF